ncbi:MAG: hypothetical protein IPM63_18075 [Acidobacteriota bacterium]|nr:MAG: hypothetical protein IPM63_18075 [Acidobacteriota bacterium]
MSKGYSIEFREDHLLVVLAPDYKVNAENRKAFWKHLHDACLEFDTRRVLVEGEIPREDRETDDVIDAGKSTAAVPHLWLAFSIPDWEPTPLAALFKTMAKISGVRVKFFPDSEKALNWLRMNGPK